MTATGHAVIGALIAAKVSDPSLAIPVAILSHIAADAFPHWDTGTNKDKKTKMQFFIESVVDLALGYTLAYLILAYFFPGTNLVYGLVIVTAAQLLDWASAPYNFFNMKFPPFSWVYRFQKSFDNRMDKPWGVIFQAGILLFLLSISVLTR